MELTSMDYKLAVRVAKMMEQRQVWIDDVEKSRKEIKREQTRLEQLEASLAADEYVIVRATGHHIDKIHKKWVESVVAGATVGIRPNQVHEFASFIAENRGSGTKGIGK